MNYGLNYSIYFIPLQALRKGGYYNNYNLGKGNYANNFTISTKRKSQDDQEE